MLNGLLIDIEYCSGCRSCEVACRNEHGFGPEQFGIKVCEVGPFVVDAEADVFVWDYHPEVTELCDTCALRRAEGQQAACELHCLADAIEVGPVDELLQKMEAKGKKASLIIP